MQSFAASSNTQIATFSPARVRQWKKSMEGHLSSTNIAMRCQPNFCRRGKIADKWLNVPSAYMTCTPKPTYLDFNGGTINEDTRKNQRSEVEMQVRDNELDQYGVVNNAVYSRYCLHGHQELLKKVGLGTDLVGEAEEATTLSDLSLKFFAALRSGDRFIVRTKISCISTTSIFVEDFIFRLPNRESGDRFIVRTKISCISTTSIFVEDFIFRLPNRELILQARATIILIDRNCRPIHISPGVKANLLMLDFFENCD